MNIVSLEEHLPFVSISVPNWLKREHPELERNLERNKRLLTSNFDIYITLQDILRRSKGDWGSLDKQENWMGFAERGQSLFRPLSPKRTCEIAGVPSEICVCRHEHTMNINSTNVTRSAMVAVRHINDLLISESGNCATLRLNQGRFAYYVINK